METITSFEDARREIARIDHDAKLVPPNEITPLLTTFIPRMLAVLDFLIVQAADFKPRCSKCGSALERHSDGYLGCRQCAINEIASQYGQQLHDDALSKLVKDMDHEDAMLKQYDAAEVLAQTMSTEDSQAKAAMDFKHPGEDEQNALAMHGPKDVLVEHAHEAEARLARMAMYKRVFGVKRPTETEQPMADLERAETAQDRQAVEDAINRLVEVRESTKAIIVATSLSDPKHVTYVTSVVPHRHDATFGIYKKDALVMPFYEALGVWKMLRDNPQGASYRIVGVVPIESADDADGAKGPPGVGPASVLVSFTLNTKPFAVAQPKMTGKEIKALLPEDKRNHAIYVEMAGMSADMKVGDDEGIDVANREIYSVPPAVFGSGGLAYRMLDGKYHRLQPDSISSDSGPKMFSTPCGLFLTPAVRVDPIAIIDAKASMLCEKCFPSQDVHEEAKQQVDKLLGEAVEINVNSDKETLYFKDGEAREITYEQIIRMACDQIDKSKGRPVKPADYDQFPHMSVTYRHKVPFDQLPGERDGMMCRGQKVAVTPGMIINAYCT